jgi:hypothetical protein
MSDTHQTTKTQISKNHIVILFILSIVIFGFVIPNQTEKPREGQINAQASFEVKTPEDKLKSLEDEQKALELEKQKILKEKEIAEIDKSLEGLKAPAPVVDDKTELPKQQTEVKVEPAKVENSSIPDKDFKLNGGKIIKGQELLNIVKGNENGLKLWQAFYNEFGLEVADTSAISLFYENGSLKVDSVGVCSAKYMIGGDYRNCNYADLNSAGMDAGLKQINTFYQAERITKLGGEACNFGNSRDRQDPCNQKKLAWLLNVDNNIKISLDIYREHKNFHAWYGYKRAFNV